jgi:uncharacterized protein (UPF0276 family)
MTTHTGIGLRQPHYAALLQSPKTLHTPQAPPPLAFVEVHSENFFATGGAALAVLQQAREQWPVSLHGVGLALGSAVGVDAAHLEQLAALVQRVDPVRVSDHASFARAPRRSGGPVVHGNDLLPIAFTPAALDIMVANVQQVQERLKRPILVENLSAYLHWADDTLAEPAFFNELARRSGCGLLLDVNNLVVNALNEKRDEAAAVASACAWVDAINAQSVGEIHLAGYNAAGDIVIDDHGSRVHEPVWQVFAHTIKRLGARPTLIEWDTDLPELGVLLQEAQRAEQLLAEVAA